MPRSFWLFAIVVSGVFGCARPAEPPSKARGDAVTLEASASSRYLRADTRAPVLVEVAVGVRPLERAGRPPANLALVVDTSGSMEGKPIEDARAAATALLDALSPKDRLAVVVFNSKTDVLLSSTLIDDADLKDVRAKIAAIPAEGTTDMASGLEAGVREVAAHLDADGINRVILLGDGVPNDASRMGAIAQSAAASGVSVTALGLGPDYNETLMGRLAQVTGGRFQYVEDSSKVASFFKEEVARLQRTYARDAWLELTAGPGVAIDGVIGQATERTSTGVRVHVGDLALGEKMDVVVKLTVDERKAGAAVELMDAVLRFTEGTGGAAAERRAFVGAHATSDPAKVSSGRNAEVEAAAVRAQDAADTLERIRIARESDAPKQPVPRAPASPSPAPAQAKDVAVEGEKAQAPGGQGAAAAPAVSPENVRRQHDDAMRVLQKH